MTSGPCEHGLHDWRVDPAGFVYSSMPPKRRIVCAKCGAISYLHPRKGEQLREVRDWPKWVADR